MDDNTVKTFKNPEKAKQAMCQEWSRMSPEERLLEQAALRVDAFEEGTLKGTDLVRIRDLHDWED